MISKKWIVMPMMAWAIWFALAMPASAMAVQDAPGKIAPATSAQTAPSERQGPIQVFDVAQGKIIKSVPNDSRFQEMAAAWAASVTGLAPQVSPGEDYAYVFRMPLEKAVPIDTGTVHIKVTTLFMFYGKDKQPLLLGFDDNRKPYLFTFKSNVSDFIKRMELPQ